MESRFKLVNPWSVIQGKMSELRGKSAEKEKQEKRARRINWLLTFLTGISIVAMTLISCAVSYLYVQPIDELSTEFVLKISLLNTLVILLIFVFLLWNAFQGFLRKNSESLPVGLGKVSSGFQLIVTGLGLEVAETVGLGLFGLSGPLSVVFVGGMAATCVVTGIAMCSLGVVSLFQKDNSQGLTP